MSAIGRTESDEIEGQPPGQRHRSWARNPPAWLGATVGGVVVGGSAVLIARAAGVDESLADYGLPYQLLLGGGCLGAALGCYLALRATRQGRALSSAAILFVSLAPSALLAARKTHSGPGWPSTWEFAFGFLIFVALPLVLTA